MSIENPYQSPAPSADPFQNYTTAQQYSGYSYRPLKTLSWWARISLWLTALAVLVMSTADIIANFAVPGYVEGDFALEGIAIMLIGLVGLAGLSMLVLMVSNVIAVTMWMYRANANIRAMGTQSVEYTPGWTVAYWFIPFLNLVRPYQAMKEIYQASAADPATATQSVAWKSIDVPLYFGIWWAAWIIGNILWRVESKLIENGVVDLTVLTIVSVVGVVLSVTGALLAAKIIGTIDRLQTKRMGG